MRTLDIRSGEVEISGLDAAFERQRTEADHERCDHRLKKTSDPHRAAAVPQQRPAQGGGRDEPKPLVITIEEAHKFLDPAIASQTIFGTIARELRKYNVTLLIVDQRPSGIDPEVMSQIGTRVTCLLDDESDIRAVFSGVSGGAELRQVLARLDTRQQALILGHAVPMPVVIRTRDTTTADYYATLGYTEGDDLQKKFERNKRALGRDGGGLD